MTVTERSSSSMFSFVARPKMMFAFLSAERRIRLMISRLSSREMEPFVVMLMRIFFAPSIWRFSRRGLKMAPSTASLILFSPLPFPTPRIDSPEPRMIVHTSAKSTLMSPGLVMISVTPFTPAQRRLSARMNCSRKVFFLDLSSLP